MTPRTRTVADAIALFDRLAERMDKHEDAFDKHVDTFDTHVSEQREFNKEITNRVVDAEKKDIEMVGEQRATNSKLDDIKVLLEKRRLGWQVWLSLVVASLLSIATLVVSILALVVNAKGP